MSQERKPYLAQDAATQKTNDLQADREKNQIQKLLTM